MLRRLVMLRRLLGRRNLRASSLQLNIANTEKVRNAVPKPHRKPNDNVHIVDPCNGGDLELFGHDAPRARLKKSRPCGEQRTGRSNK
jgi:hypothetical protein